MDEDQRMMYQQLVITRINDVNLRWRITQLFFILHSAALVAVLAQLELGSRPYFIASFTGIFANLPWFLIIWRIGNWISYWNSRLVFLETMADQTIRVFGEEFSEVQEGSVSTNFIIVVLITGFAAIWLVLVVLGFIEHFTPPPLALVIPGA